ncbi:MAG: PhoPQ-activated pathogenicity [Planctomycetes bacterium]|nr:PhoPQ-activated pathogenicity [Planctomycetota bacterium]
MKTRNLIRLLIVTIVFTMTYQNALSFPPQTQNITDPNYHYTLTRTINHDDYTAYVLSMTSQTWLSNNEVDRVLWRHWLTIIKPNDLKHQTALLWINGGNNGSATPPRINPMIANIALKTNSIVADLQMVPNQPLIFTDEKRPRFEDAILAYSFDKYLKTGDKKWPVLLPMVQSARRAMDTVQNYLSSMDDNPEKIENFVVSGASKRGWTTWLTAVHDSRIVAIIPLVIDVLNMDEQMQHHYQSYGFYAPAIRDYVALNVFDHFDTTRGQDLVKIVDPYEYRHKLTMPKFMINSTGDQFFLPDSAQFYFADLPGQKYLRYIPNTDHSLGRSDVQESLTAFYLSILNQSPRPEFSWRITQNGEIVVQCQQKSLRQVKLWQAKNEKHRDFRLDTIGPVWKSSTVMVSNTGVFSAKPNLPDKGWIAYFVELTFDSGSAIPFKFTTEINVLPKNPLWSQKYN